MSEVNDKYMGDKDGNIFSPMTSSRTVFMDDGTDLQTYLENLPESSGGV